MSELKRGDWVQHECGGPDLMIEGFSRKLALTVHWDGEKFVFNKFFPEQLKCVDERRAARLMRLFERMNP